VSVFHPHEQGVIVSSLNQISDLAKGELRAWLEPWLQTRGTTTIVGTGGTTGPAGGVLAGNYPNPVFAADMATQAELDSIVIWEDIGSGAAGAYGTTLPASPFDGQQAILVDSLTAPTWSWHLRYTAGVTAAQKWLFIGGSPLFGSSLASGAMAGGWNPYVPALTVPFAGVYRVAASATIAIPGATPSAVAVSYTINGTPGFATNQGVGVCAAGNSLSCSINPTPITVAAGDAVGIGAYTGVAANISLAWVSLEPRQVG
jgi:hypothetical protein